VAKVLARSQPAVEDEFSIHRRTALADAELVQRADATNYRITEKGKQYLNGEIDTAALKINDK